MTSMLSLQALPAFSDNYVWVLANDRYCVAVDPGDPQSLIEFCAHTGIQLAAVLLTHHHFDHVNGVPELRAVFGAELAVHGPCATIASVNRPACGADRIRIAGLDIGLEVLALPGHTHDHLAYLCDAGALGAPVLFCGDVLFAAGCGRIIEGTADQLMQSLDVLNRLPGDTLVCCAHEYTLKNLRFAAQCDPGNAELRHWQEQAIQLRHEGLATLPTRLDLERRVNPFLRVDRPEVQAAVAHLSGVPVRGRRDTFAMMRALRDGFH